MNQNICLFIKMNFMKTSSICLKKKEMDVSTPELGDSRNE
jgi:hypothetical protein